MEYFSHHHSPILFCGIHPESIGNTTGVIDGISSENSKEVQRTAEQLLFDISFTEKKISKTKLNKNNAIAKPISECLSNEKNMAHYESSILYKETERETIFDVMESLHKIFDTDYVRPNDEQTDKSSISKEFFQSKPSGIKRKRNVEHKNIDGNFSCEECDFKTNYEQALKRHKEAIHKGVCYTCEQCDYKATTKGSLKLHVANKHEGVVFSCNQCIYKATTKPSLKQHVQFLHEGVVYPCSHCDYKGRHRGALNRHVKMKHI